MLFSLYVGPKKDEIKANASPGTAPPTEINESSVVPSVPKANDAAQQPQQQQQQQQVAISKRKRRDRIPERPNHRYIPRSAREK